MQSSISLSVAVICTIDNGRLMYSRMRIYYKSKKMSSAEKEREREAWLLAMPSIHPWKHQRTKKKGKRCFSAYAFYESTAARRRLSIGNDFRANVSEMRSMINVIRGGRAATSWGWGRERKRDRREPREENLASKLQSSARGGDRRSPINERERGRESRTESTSPPKTAAPASHSLPAGMEDKGRALKNGEMEFKSEHHGRTKISPDRRRGRVVCDNWKTARL